jgi:hypothetical protein
VASAVARARSGYVSAATVSRQVGQSARHCPVGDKAEPPLRRFEACFTLASRADPIVSRAPTAAIPWPPPLRSRAVLRLKCRSDRADGVQLVVGVWAWDASRALPASRTFAAAPLRCRLLNELGLEPCGLVVRWLPKRCLVDDCLVGRVSVSVWAAPVSRSGVGSRGVLAGAVGLAGWQIVWVCLTESTTRLWVIGPVGGCGCPPTGLGGLRDRVRPLSSL